MKKYMQSVLVIFILCFINLPAFAIYLREQASQKNETQPTRLIVKFNANQAPVNINTIKGSIRTGLVKVDALTEKYHIKAITPLMNKPALSASSSIFSNVYLMEIENTDNLSAIISEYEKLPNVEYAEPDYFVKLYDTPNDSLYNLQWSLHNTGQEHYHILRTYGSNNDTLIMVNGITDSDIDAEEVYQNPPDRTVTVVVAVIDTGADMDHPDLAENIWVNPGEIPDNGIDDDHNGYIDDVNGWDFASTIDAQDPGDNDPTDMVGHGSHCAGIIAAVTDNDIGIAGIATNCKIMPLNFDPLPLVSRVAGAMIYAADNGADVFSMSFGLTYRSDLIEEACNYARSKGAVLLAASGNSGLEEFSFPATYESVMAVGASNDSDRVTSFSTHGPHISVVAPGLAILSLRADLTDIHASQWPREPKVHIIDSIYYMMSGTSMACPHAAGVAAQLRSASAGLTPERTQYIMEQSADDIVDPYGVGWNYPGWDQYAGYGRVNLDNALAMVPQVRAAISSPIQNEIVSGMVDIVGIADGDDFMSYSINYGESNNPSEWFLLEFSNNPITDDILTSWDTDGINGRYTLKLKNGLFNITDVSIYLINDTTAEILSPEDGETVANFVTINGDAYAPEFSQYKVEYKADTATEWTELDNSSIPAFREKTGGWYLENIPPGDYYIRLSVYSGEEILIADTNMVHIQSIFDTDQAWRSTLTGYPTIIPNYGDFDNDGVNEIIVGTATGIDVFNIDGTPKTERMPDFPRNNFMIPIAVGNLDDDGIDDMVAIGYDPPMLYGYPSSAEHFESYIGIFPPLGNFFMTEHEFPKVYLKDMDNDGMDEIIAFIYDYSLSKTFIFKSDGTLINSFTYLSEFLPVDLDNDRQDEIYASTYGFGLLRQIDPYTAKTKDSLLIQMNGSRFTVMGLTGYDIDNDAIMELIVFGFYPDFGYWLYAFEDGLNLIDGWPHDLGVDDFVVPTVPVFGDLNGDNIPEYLTTFFDISASYVLAWNIDGTPYIPNSLNGLFTTSPEPAVMNLLLLADMDGDGQTDIISCADNDMFNTFEAQRIYAWDNEANLLAGFPIITVPDAFTSDRFTPVIGDIDDDGNVDLIMTTPDLACIYLNFPGCPYVKENSPAPFWRYNRRMNNLGPLPEQSPTDIADETTNLLSTEYYLAQNRPNPFNPVTIIEYSIPNRSNVEISIFNILGQKIKTLVNELQSAGNYKIDWNGKNETGNKVASGIYFYLLKTDDFTQTKKMILLK